MAGSNMLEFIPLNESATSRVPEVLEWVRSWTGIQELNPLTPEEWFERGHGISGGTRKPDGVWEAAETGERWLLWAPAPAAAEIAMDELLTSRHKRTYINHVIAVPKLMTHEWRKKMQKVCDVVFEIPPGRRSFWPSEMHEPLVVGLTLRFVSVSPWQLKTAGAVVDLARQLRSVWKDKHADDRAILRQLCLTPGLLDGM